MTTVIPDHEPNDSWDWSDEDQEIVAYTKGNDEFKIIVGKLEYYGRGVFILKKDGHTWTAEEILGRPEAILGFKINDES